MNTDKATDLTIIKTSQGLGILLQALEPFFNEWNVKKLFPKKPDLRARGYGKFITFVNLERAYNKAKDAAYFEFIENGGQDDGKENIEKKEITVANKIYGERTY